MKPLLHTALILLAFAAVGWTSGSEENHGDRFGGLPVKVGAPSPSFSVKKVGDRWTLVTPDGNAFFMLGVMDVDTMQTDIGNGTTYDSVLFHKYGDRRHWADAQTHRLKSWGFNTLAEYQSYYALAFPTAASRGANPMMPSVTLMKFSYYSYTNREFYKGQKAAPDAVKDLVDCQSNVFRGYRGADFPDVFDPDFADYIDGMLQAMKQDDGESGRLLSPWVLGVTADEVDNNYGFGPGTEIPGVDGVVHAHLGWMALSCAPTMGSSSKWHVKYKDATVHSKAEFIRWVKEKYKTIAALNVAWGSNYTSFETDGGWGRGSGLADEDGRHTAWLGDTAGELRGARPGVVRDLDAFLLHIARQYFRTTTEAFHRHAPGKLVFSSVSLNGHQGLSRKQVLQAAGESVDVLNVFIRDQRVLDKTIEYAGDKPITTYEISAANPDSGLWLYPNPKDGGFDGFNTQSERGAAYIQRLRFLQNARAASTGSHPIVGLKWWQYVDNWAEHSSFGLVSVLDNPYDGQPTSGAYGEARQYGDFIGRVKQANQAALDGFLQALQNNLAVAATADPKKAAPAAERSPKQP